MSSELAKKNCVPCKGGVPPLIGSAIHRLHEALGGGWEVVNEHHLDKTYKFRNWQDAIDFVNAISPIAEAQNHHPDLEVGWGKVRVIIFTHKIGGLTESDFVLAAKFDEALSK